MKHYVLDKDHTVRSVGREEWVKWIQFENNLRVDFTVVDGGTRVSTIFLGIDHNSTMMPTPKLFETMVVGGELDQEQERYATWDEAKVGHGAMVALVIANAGKTYRGVVASRRREAQHDHYRLGRDLLRSRVPQKRGGRDVSG